MNTETIGKRELSAWQVVPGVCWVQTRSPQFARKLSQRSDARLVARGVAGGYLRTFEFQHGMSWARRLYDRYTQKGTATNAQKNRPRLPAMASDGSSRMTTPPTISAPVSFGLDVQRPWEAPPWR